MGQPELACTWLQRCQQPAQFTVVQDHLRNEVHALPTICATHLAQAVLFEAHYNRRVEVLVWPRKA